MYSIGIDLGGTNIVAAVVNKQYQILSKASCKTLLPRAAESVIEDMEKITREAIEKADIRLEDVSNIGIGSPGVIDPVHGVIHYSCNFDYYNVPMASMLKDRLKKPVFMQNDARSAALGEYLAGGGKDGKSMIIITLGTGVGGGIIMDGKIYNGFNFAGSELGHMVIHAGGRSCNCGRKGCFESYASATGLIKTTQEYMRAHPESALWKIAGKLENVEGRTAFDAMEMGDQTANKVVKAYIQDLAVGLINIINIFQPEILCIGGGISHQGDKLIQFLQPLIDQEDYARTLNHRTKIVTAKLGNDAGLIGAAMLSKYQ